LLTVIIVLIAIALIFDFLNGFNDSGNIVATVISSHALSPRSALTLAAIAEFLGPFLFGVAIAKTIGEEIVAPQAITLAVIYAALLAAIVWNLITWFLGIPSSSSHALFGGIIGAVVIHAGYSVLRLNGIAKIFIALFTSPLIGLLVGFLLTKVIFFLARGASPKINNLFKNSQVFTAIALALSHGANDAQKTMGIITLALLTGGYLTTFTVPVWVIGLSASSIALGMATGGWRVIRTLGGKFYKIRPVHGFATQISSATVIMGAAVLGGPVSTTQVVSSVIMGVGSAERVSKVRWNVAGEIMTAWLFTIPSTALLAALFKIALSNFLAF